MKESYRIYTLIFVPWKENKDLMLLFCLFDFSSSVLIIDFAPLYKIPLQYIVLIVTSWGRIVTFHRILMISFTTVGIIRYF